MATFDGAFAAGAAAAGPDAAGAWLAGGGFGASAHPAIDTIIAAAAATTIGRNITIQAPN